MDRQQLSFQRPWSLPSSPPSLSVHAETLVYQICNEIQDRRLTTSISSLSATIFSSFLFLSLAFAFAVVDRTAVVTLGAASLLGGLMAGG